MFDHFVGLTLKGFMKPLKKTFNLEPLNDAMTFFSFEVKYTYYSVFLIGYCYDIYFFFINF